MVKGQTLIKLGFKQGKWFKGAIEHANHFQLEGDELLAYLKTVEPNYLSPHSEPQPYYKNIKATTNYEKDNLRAVIQTMDKVMQVPTTITGAIMPDACPAGPIGQIPVGGVVVTKNAIHPAMHSADICCSVMLTNLGDIDPKSVLDTAQSTTHFGGGGRNDDLFSLPRTLEDRIKSNPILNNQKCLQLAKTQLGTQGDGNHFLYVGQSQKTEETMLITHHGSRGLGANLYKSGMKIAEAFRLEISPDSPKQNAWIPFDTIEGKQYWEALQIIRDWTKLNHQVLHHSIAKQLGLDSNLKSFWNEHNFVFKENDLFYHAKGATPLKPSFIPDAQDNLRLIPLNMSEPILIVQGETHAHNLGFAPHGAGRNMSRSKHKRLNQAYTDQEIFERETQDLDIRFFSKHIDISELPSAYKNAQEVQEQMQAFDLGEIVDRVMPYGCIMAGDWQIDAPWRVKARNKHKRLS